MKFISTFNSTFNHILNIPEYYDITQLLTLVKVSQNLKLIENFKLLNFSPNYNLNVNFFEIYNSCNWLRSSLTHKFVALDAFLSNPANLCLNYSPNLYLLEIFKSNMLDLLDWSISASSKLDINFWVLGITSKYNIFDIYTFWNLHSTPKVIESFNLLGVYPELFLILAISIFLGFLVVYDYLCNYKLILSTFTIKMTIGILLLTLLLLSNSFLNDVSAFNNLLVSNYLTTSLKVILVSSAIFCLIISYDYIKSERIVNYEYCILLLLALLGMCLIISSNDLMTLYLGIELQGLCFYILAAFKVHNNFSTEAGIKYFILGAFASGMLLFGMSLVYGFTGLTNFRDLSMLFFTPFPSSSPGSIGILMGVFFIIVGLLFKSGAAPFHMWVPDVYEGVPTSVTAIYAILPKIALFSVLLKLNEIFVIQQNTSLISFLLLSSILCIIIGTLGALYQTKIKRLLAFSAITHVGYLLLAVCASAHDSLIFYFLVYMGLSISMFAFLLNIRSWDNNLKIKNINELILLAKSNLPLAIIFTSFLFSIAGIPPLLGFYSKFFVFVAALQSGLYAVVIIAATLSVVSSMYYIRLIKVMFFKKTKNRIFYKPWNLASSLIVSYLALINIFFMINPSLLLNWTKIIALYYKY